MKGKFFWLCLLPAMLALSGFADQESGHGGMFWALTGVSIGLVILIRLGSLSWFYAFMAGFFVLGCWFKVVMHHLSDLPYVEPSGNFGNSLAEWQEYYLFATAIGAALLVVRVLQIAVARRQGAVTTAVALRPVTGGTWTRFVLFNLVFYIINNLAGFFVTGVDAKVVLPGALNAPLAFLALIGNAVILATLVDRDVQARGRLTLAATFSMLLVCGIASVSMASRAAIVMQAVPILLAASLLQIRSGRYKLSKWPLLLFGLTVLLVLVAVSLYRIQVYRGGGDQDALGFYVLESALLVVDRWVGAEALMVAVAEPTRSWELFMRLLAEAPSVGVDSIYQQLSGGKYEFLQGLTFLTLPGYFGIVGLTGDVMTIFLLVLAIAFAGSALEALVQRLLVGQVVPVALVSAAMANALTQLSFPPLLVPFIIQMLVLCALIGWLGHARRRRAIAQRSGPGEGVPA